MESARCRAFLAAVETGSLSRAAERLSYTPSGVSQLVAALEQELGFPLLARSNKGVHPTADGARLLSVVREYLCQEERLYQEAAEIRGLMRGTITVASYTSVTANWLPRIIGVFQKDYPQVEVNLLGGFRRVAVQYLEEKRADLAIFSHQEPMPYDWIPLAEIPMVAVLSKSHPLADALVYPLSRCSEERFIMPDQGWDDDVVALFQENGIKPGSQYFTPENFTALSLIEQGLGMSVMNELVTQNWTCNVAKLPLDPPASITMGLAIPSLDHASPAVKRFVKYVVQHLTKKQCVSKAMPSECDQGDEGA